MRPSDMGGAEETRAQGVINADTALSDRQHAQTGTTEPRVMWRPMRVCAPCWHERYPDRQAAAIIEPGEPSECIACEKPTSSGIFVRMRVEWP